MSQANTPSFPDFGKLVPGFDFLQNLAKQAASGATQAMPQLPNFANWIAPVLNVEEIDKRVQELKAVQFWLDQNAAALKATIQALEVQKMTLATLKGMNFNMADMANAFTLKTGEAMTENMQRMADKAKAFPGLEVAPSAFQAAKAEAESSKSKPEEPAPSQGAAAAGSIVDPMQWWGALTQQFQTIAAEAMKEVATNQTTLEATTNLATGLAKDAVKTATDMAKGMAESATKTMTGSRAAMDTALKGGWPAPGAAPRKSSRAAAPKADTPKAPAAKTAAKTAAAKTRSRASTGGTTARKTTR